VIAQCMSSSSHKLNDGPRATRAAAGELLHHCGAARPLQARVQCQVSGCSPPRGSVTLSLACAEWRMLRCLARLN
jgi:hypothetical protein